MTVKLQINSLEALERLIGNDTELEVELRASIVENFAKKYLKNIANEEIMKKAASAIRAEVLNTFFEVVKRPNTCNSSGTETVFKPEFLEKIRKDLIHTAELELNGIITEVVNNTKNVDTITTALNRATDYIVNSLTEANLNTRLNRMVDAKLKNMLNI